MLWKGKLPVFTFNQRNSTVSVLLIGGKNDHTIHRTQMLSKEFIVPGRYGKWERFVRTREMRSVKVRDGTLETFRVYEFDSEVKR